MGNSCKFSQFRDNIGEKLGLKLPKLGKFWEVKPPLRSQKWDFWGKVYNNIFTTPFWEYYGSLSNSGKKLGHKFPSLGKYWTKNWEHFVLEEIEITILGKYWEILRRHSTCPNVFFYLGNFFPKMGKYWEQSC